MEKHLLPNPNPYLHKIPLGLQINLNNPGLDLNRRRQDIIKRRLQITNVKLPTFVSKSKQNHLQIHKRQHNKDLTKK